MALLLKIYNENPHPRQIEKVVNILRNGGLVIYPTDTVYGLGCDITHTKAMEKLAKIKGVKPEKSNFPLSATTLVTFQTTLNRLAHPPIRF